MGVLFSGPSPATQALWSAAAAGDEVKTAAALAESADMCAADPAQYSMTAVHKAALYGHAVVVRALLDAGAPVSSLDEDGHTPLHLAASSDHDAVVAILLAAGASVNAVDQFGFTPLHEAATWTNNVRLVRMLLEAGADMEAADVARRTPLHQAALKDNASVIAALADAGAMVDAIADNGYTPLHVAADVGDHENVDAVTALLAAGASPHPRTASGYTALDLAAGWGHHELVEKLKAAARAHRVPRIARFASQYGSTASLGVPTGAASTEEEARAERGEATADGAHANVARTSPTVGATPEHNPTVDATRSAAATQQAHVSSDPELPPPTPTASERPSHSACVTPTPPDAHTPSRVPPPTPKVVPSISCELQLRDIKFDRDEDDMQIELGRGGYGIVYAGRWSGERAAIKKVHLPKVFVEEGAFWREVRLQMMASHPHVVRVYGAAVKASNRVDEFVDCYIVMSCMVADLGSILHESVRAAAAQHLKSLVAQYPHRLRLLLEVARGLRFLHARGIVHADLKPSNVMLDADGHAQLADFGLAVQRAPDAASSHASHKGVRGTLAYMDPLLMGGRVCVQPSSDIYSWGVLAWEVLTARKPYEGKVDGGGGGGGGDGGGGASSIADAETPLPLNSALPTFTCLTFDDARPADVLASMTHVAPALRDVIQRCWSAEQAARPTAEALIDVLTPLVEAAV